MVVMPYILSALYCGHFSSRTPSFRDPVHARRVHRARPRASFHPVCARSPPSSALPRSVCRSWSRLSLISREATARLVCGSFEAPVFRSGDFASARETGRKKKKKHERRDGRFARVEKSRTDVEMYTTLCTLDIFPKNPRMKGKKCREKARVRINDL